MNHWTNYVPLAAISRLEDMLDDHIVVRVVKSRKRKWGDFRRQLNGRCLITVNNDLNQQAFLITLVHEIAHYNVYKQYKGKVRPHGKEWKVAYKDLLKRFLDRDCFSSEVLEHLTAHLHHIKSSTCYDPKLHVLLDDKPQGTPLKELEVDVVFRYHNNTYLKIKDRRTRTLCKQTSTQKLYTILKDTPVQIL